MRRKLSDRSRASRRRVSLQRPDSISTNARAAERDPRPSRSPASNRSTSTARAQKSLKIELANRQRLWPVRAKKIRVALSQVLHSEGVEQGHVEVAFVDDEAIRQIHRQFLNIDTPTDVLTFPLHESKEPLAGLIVLSVETAKRESGRHGQTVEDEILLYAIHGILHLTGYDDRTPSDARRMHRRQVQLLRAVRRG